MEGARRGVGVINVYLSRGSEGEAMGRADGGMGQERDRTRERIKARESESERVMRDAEARARVREER